jgi:hypothetical protein
MALAGYLATAAGASRARNKGRAPSIPNSTFGSVRADALPRVMTQASGSSCAKSRQSNSR